MPPDPGFLDRRTIADGLMIAEGRWLDRDVRVFRENMTESQRNRSVGQRLRTMYQLATHGEGRYIQLIERLYDLDKTIRQDMLAVSESSNNDPNSVSHGFFARRPTMRSLSHLCSKRLLVHREAARLKRSPHAAMQYVPAHLTEDFVDVVPQFTGLEQQTSDIFTAITRTQVALMYLGKLEDLSEVPEVAKQVHDHVNQTRKLLSLRSSEPSKDSPKPWDEII